MREKRVIIANLLAFGFSIIYWEGIRRIFQALTYSHFHDPIALWGATLTGFIPRLVALVFISGVILGLLWALIMYYSLVIWRK